MSNDNYTINEVHIDASTIIKIVQHAESESNSSQITGILIGLADGKRLEITNSIPQTLVPETITEYEKHIYYKKDDEVQLEMLKYLRKVNMDYLTVGFYQVASSGDVFTRAILDGIFSYQDSLEESILLVYDHVRLNEAQISLKAYKIPDLLKHALQKIDDENKLKDVFQKMRLDYQHMFVEIPVFIRNSHLSRILLMDICDRIRFEEEGDNAETTCKKPSSALSVMGSEKFSGLSMAVSDTLEGQLKSLVDILDNVQVDSMKYVRKKPYFSFNPLRLDTALLSKQTDEFCNQIASTCEQMLGKLNLTKALQEASSRKSEN